MSFGFGVGDFIAGANLAHKLIRVMTETRGASAEYQEALAEVCGIQQIFIQLTQLCRSKVLPRATLNSLAQIIMPSMSTIADFLDKTKHYQEKLSPGGGLSSSWCKMGWALFRKEELKLLRDTLHSRLSSINTLLAAANHFPSMPESVAQYQVKDDDQENDVVYTTYLDAASPHDVGLEEQVSTFYESTPSPATLPPYTVEDDKRESEIEVLAALTETDSGQPPTPAMIDYKQILETKDNLHSESIKQATSIDQEVINITKKTKELLQAPPSPLRQPKSQHKFPLQTIQTLQAHAPQTSATRSTTRSTTPLKIPRAPTKQQISAGGFETYFQTLIESAINIQAEAEAKAAAEKKAAEEAEWRKKLEEVIRLEAEFKIRQHIDSESRALEEEKLAQEQLKKAEEAKMSLLLREAEEEKKREKKLPLKFKDAVGRKFTFPFEACNTWQTMEDLIKQAFLHVDVIGPHVQKGHYDLIGPSGEIILPQMWDKVIEPDWSVTMHMWPMDKKPQRPQPPSGGFIQVGQPPPQPGPPPPPMPGGLMRPMGGVRPPGAPPPNIVQVRRPAHLGKKQFDSDSESDSDSKDMFSLRGYLGKKMKRIRKKVSRKKDSDSIYSSSDSGVLGWDRAG